MASTYFRYSLKPNKTAYGKPQAKLAVLRELVDGAQHKLIATLAKHEAAMKRAEEALKRCDQLLTELQEIKEESVSENSN